MKSDCLLLFTTTLAVVPMAIADPPPAPELKAFEPFVVRVGETNRLMLEGEHLGNIRFIWTSRHGIIETDELDAEPLVDGKQVSLNLRVDSSTACGPFALRIITDAGVSEPRLGFLESLPELDLGEDRTVSGTGFLKGTIDQPGGAEYRVKLNEGDTLSIDVIAGQFGSRLDPVLIIQDSQGGERCYVHDSRGLGVDCHELFEAPRGDTYTLVIRDARYESGDGYRYHLRFGTVHSGMASPYVRSDIHNQVFAFSAQARVPDPPAYAERKNRLIESEMQQRPLGLLVASESRDGRDPAYRLDAIATYPVATLRRFLGSEEEMPFPPQALAGSSINGWFAKPDEVTALRLIVQQPGTYRWVAISRRLGGHSDPAMRLKTTDGTVLAESHLFQNESVLKHEFREAGEYVMDIWDLAGQYGDNTHYHIQAQPDPAEFELNTETDSLRIEAGGNAELKVSINRDGYRGPVKFAVTTNVEGVALQDNLSKKNANEATFKIALSDALSPGTTFPIKISGVRGEENDAPRAPLYTQAYWKNRFRDLYSPMFEFEDTIWVTVVPKPKAEEPKSEEKSDSPDEARK